MKYTIFDVQDGDFILVNEDGRRTAVCSKETVLYSTNFFGFFMQLKGFARESVPKEFT